MSKQMQWTNIWKKSVSHSGLGRRQVNASQSRQRLHRHARNTQGKMKQIKILLIAQVNILYITRILFCDGIILLFFRISMALYINVDMY